MARPEITGSIPDLNMATHIATASPIEIALLGTVVLLAAPLFIRFALPTRSLPDGPLRRRLERVAQRAGFRFSDVRVWDTTTGQDVLDLKGHDRQVTGLAFSSDGLRLASAGPGTIAL